MTQLLISLSLSLSLSIIIHSPLIKLSDKLTGTPDVTIYAKAEFTNPCSSVKDRYVKRVYVCAALRGVCVCRSSFLRLTRFLLLFLSPFLPPIHPYYYTIPPPTIY